MATEDVHILPLCSGVSIHFGDIKELTETSITFDGYLRAEPELFPIRRIFIRGCGPSQRWLLVSIDSIETLEDTSKGWYDDEEGGYIVLTPTALIKINYRVLKTLDGPADEVEQIHNELVQELEQESERNWKLRAARERREFEAVSGMSFKHLFDKATSCPRLGVAPTPDPNPHTCSRCDHPADCSGQCS